MKVQKSCMVLSPKENTRKTARLLPNPQFRSHPHYTSKLHQNNLSKIKKLAKLKAKSKAQRKTHFFLSLKFLTYLRKV
jgi:hypothetical protein